MRPTVIRGMRPTVIRGIVIRGMRSTYNKRNSNKE
jgi:hypothetical protein